MVNLYKILCLTNLHVGSGEINYSIVDNEVERDVNGYPVIHSSGLKGALREQAEKNQFKLVTPPDEKIKYDKAKVEAIFGQTAGSGEIKPGSYKFFDGRLISRPMRVSGSDSMASISVFSLESINSFLDTITAFGLNPFNGVKQVDKALVDFGTKDFVSKKDFVSNVNGIQIEGEEVGALTQEAVDVLKNLESVIGERYAIVRDLNKYNLPVIARNYLENGISKNLWYEEVVPHGSVFYTLIITPGEENELDMKEIKQIGGHASIGYGFTQFMKLN